MTGIAATETRQIPVVAFLIEQALIEDLERTDHEIARAVLGAYQSPRDLRQAMFGLVVEEVVHVRRERSRAIEHSYSTGKANGTLHRYLGIEKGEEVDQQALADLLRTDAFYVPGKGRVLWGEATVDDHKLRIEMLESLRSGLARTISLHQAAIDRLTAAGAASLNELAVTP